MKSLIAIVNARHREAWRQAVRATWFEQVPADKADVFFFVGRGETPVTAKDIVELDCSDTYEHLPEKIRAIATWALDREYEHLLKCDDDVVLRPRDLLNSDYAEYDFSGKGNRPPQPYVVSFGFNYWLSRKSMEVVAKSTLPADGSNDDEKWVAKNLWDNGISLHNVNRYKLHTQWEPQQPEMFRRALRVPRPLMLELKNPEMFSRCIHFEGPITEEAKILEFRRVFQRYGEK